MHPRACLSRFALLSLLVVAACGPESALTTEGSGTTTGDTTTTTTSTSSSSTGVPTSSTGGPTDDGFGFACVELLRAESEDSDPFVDTAQIKVTLRYEQCLRDYYTEKHVEQALDGIEGPGTFAAWKGRLCSEPVSDPLVACEIADFQQILLDNPPNSAFQMTVTYQITDPAQIDGRTLLWGPGPTEAIAECEMGLRPYVRMTVQSDVIGVDADDQVIWSASSFSNPQGIMQHDTTGCIQVDVSRALAP